MDVPGTIIIAVGLILAGGGIGFWLGRLDRAVEQAKLEETRAELDEYRRQVAEHFGQTAGHFQALGQQYKALYEHLAHGSEKLCDAEALDRELPFPLAGEAALEQADSNSPADTLDGSALDSKSSDDSSEPAGDEVLEAATVESETDEALAEVAEIGADVGGEISADDSNVSAEPADNVVELVPRSDSSSDDPDSGGSGKDNERTYH